MLRLGTTFHAAVAAVALLSTTMGIAQGQGTLAQRLDAAQTQLDADVQTCRPINIGEYSALLAEAGKNVKRAAKATKAGAPVDAMQVDRDLVKASALLNRAQAALVQQCIRAAQQAQPQTLPPQQVQQQGEMNFSPADRQMLDAHNRLRAVFGAPPLKLNQVLIEHATARAQEMARAGEVTHAPREGRGTERENIAKVPANYSILQIFDRWAREQTQFVPGVFPKVCKTGGDCSEVLHVTAILWDTTTDLGCGSAQAGGYIYEVCRLDPGGNKDGKPVGTPQIAANSTIRARQVGGDYGKPSADTVPKPNRKGAWYVGGDFGSMIVEDIDFDFGLQPTIPSTPLEQLNHDYGYDGALFVGYDLGAFRIEAETAYKNADLDMLNEALIKYLGEPEVDTKVEQPKLPNAEIFEQTSGETQPATVSTSDLKELVEQYNETVKRYDAAWKRCDTDTIKSAGAELETLGPKLKGIMQAVGEAGNLSDYSAAFSALNVAVIDSKLNEIEAGKEKTRSHPTNVQQPALPTKEVYDPAVAPKCKLDVL